MKTLRTALAWSVAAVAIFTFPPFATAAYLIPPGNSAANQYTEAYPTSRGQNDTKRGTKAGGRSPASVLGNSNVRRLEAHGETGRAVTAVVVATAPDTIPPTATQALGTRNGAGEKAGKTRQRSDGPAPSSGLDEVIAVATGSSGLGQLSLLLPLVIVAAFSWSIAYLLRQRKKPTA